MLECVDISKNYTKGSWFSRGQTTEVLKNISFKMQEGRSLGLLGENGSGKSTLTRIILGIEEPNSGKVFFEKNDIHTMVRQGKKYFRKNMQAVFQNPVQAMNPRYTAFQVIAEPLYNFIENIEPLFQQNAFDVNNVDERHAEVNTAEKNSIEKKSAGKKAVAKNGIESKSFLQRVFPSLFLKEEIREKVKKLMRDVGLNPCELDKNVNHFSGGQQQRICIARALALNPKLLILDEAVSNLDMVIQAQILELLHHLKKYHGISLFVISHDIRVVLNLCEDILVLDKGSITDRLSVEDGVDVNALQLGKFYA